MTDAALVVFAHPALQKSRANVRLLRALDGLEGVTLDDLYERYPDFQIDVEHEQALLLDHDHVVLQHPLHWYSVPALLKQWFDLVLAWGWAYGPGGDHLAGKSLQVVTTAGGGVEAYARTGHNRYTVDELLRPIEQTARLCGMRWRPPLVVHGAGRIPANEFETVHVPAYRELLIGLGARRTTAERPTGSRSTS